MLKYLLVSASGAAGDEAVFATALATGAPFAAHLAFLHVRLDITETAVAMTSGGAGGAMAVQNVLDQLESESRQNEARVAAQVEAFCRRHGLPLAAAPVAPASGGPSAELLLRVGSASRCVAEHGRFADLLVVGRAHGEEDLALDVLEAALMDTGRPVLIAPAQPPASLTGTAVIAWKDTREAARAVAAAMPLLERASRVVILTVQEEGARPGEVVEPLAQALRWHNLDVSCRTLTPAGRHPAEELLQAVHDEGACLLVMGAYSHSRLREVVFGGFTQRILRSADLPALMAH